MEIPLKVTVDVGGMPQTVARVRGEVARCIRDVAAAESDARVVARLYEVALMVSESLSQAEAKLRIETAPEHTGLPPRLPRPLAAVPKPDVPKVG